jgi:hypothetical protein
MSEYKFGTWYPIEELEEFYSGVLFWDGDTIEKGYMSRNMLGEKRYKYQVNDSISPLMWMPLPPRPGEV